MHAVCVPLRSTFVLAARRELGLDNRNGSSGRVLRKRVDQNHLVVVAVHHFVGEVQATDAKVHDSDAGGHGGRCEPSDDLDSKPVIGVEDIADAGDEHAPRAGCVIHDPRAT